MWHAMERTVMLFLLLFLVGCGTPETRYLSFIPRPAAVEEQSYNLHDPFPDEEAGPKMGIRPRIFAKPRTDARKNLDLRFLSAAYGNPQQQYAVWDPSIPGGINNYPVQPLWRTQTAAANPVTVVPTWQP